MIWLGDDMAEDNAGDHRRFRVEDGVVYTVCLSPWTERHLSERMRSYHRLENGTYGLLKNHSRSKPYTFFRQLEVLCPATSSPEIAGVDAPCPICDVMKYILSERWGDRDYVWFHLEPRLKVTLEIGLLAIDGKQCTRRNTSFIEMPVNHLPWFDLSRVADLEFRLYRGEDCRLVLEPTGRNLSACRLRHIFGKTLVVKSHSDDFVQRVVDAMKASDFAYPWPGRVWRLREMFPTAVLVPDWWGTKHPMRRGFKEFAATWMRQWDVYEEVLDASNINFLCGPPSDNLCSIDFDVASEISRFIRYRPWAQNAPKVWGKRGVAVLFKLKGPYPPRVFHLKRDDGKGTDIGELRLGNCLQTLNGLHESGCEYRLEKGTLPEVEWEDVRPLAGWQDYAKEDGPSRPLTGLQRRRCQLDIARLNWVRDQGKFLDAQCPACAQKGKDTGHDNLRVWKLTGGFKCIAGCSRQDILDLVGNQDTDDSEEGDDDEC